MRLSTCSFVILLVAPSVLCARDIEILFHDTGSVEMLGRESGRGESYIVGDFGDNGLVYRNWFVFDIPDISRTPRAGRLEIYNPSVNGYRSPDTLERWVLYDVDPANIPLLLSDQGGNALWNDLGSGDSYGAQSIGRHNIRRNVNVPLRRSAVEEILNTDGLFAIGGALTTISSDLSENAFAQSDRFLAPRRIKLILFPEPSSIVIGLALMLACCCRRSSFRRV